MSVWLSNQTLQTHWNVNQICVSRSFNRTSKTSIECQSTNSPIIKSSMFKTVFSLSNLLVINITKIPSTKSTILPPLPNLQWFNLTKLQNPIQLKVPKIPHKALSTLSHQTSNNQISNIRLLTHEISITKHSNVSTNLPKSPNLPRLQLFSKHCHFNHQNLYHHQTTDFTIPQFNRLPLNHQPSTNPPQFNKPTTFASPVCIVLYVLDQPVLLFLCVEALHSECPLCVD